MEAGHYGCSSGICTGPLLFILLTNDLPNVVNHCRINLYADDTIIYACSKDPNLVSMHLQKDLESIMDWVTRNGLEVNIAKTQLMILNTQGRQREADRVKVVHGGRKRAAST
jgi:hypothetical protein